MIRRTLLATVLAVGGAAVAFSGVAGGHDETTTLRGTVGPGFTINLTKNGKKVARLEPGTYRIVVTDRSSRHNFKLEKSGGAFERTITTVPFTGVKTITVKVTSGRWEFSCTPHKRTMKGRFTVAAAAARTSTTTTTATTSTSTDGDDGYGGPGGGYG